MPIVSFSYIIRKTQSGKLPIMKKTDITINVPHNRERWRPKKSKLTALIHCTLTTSPLVLECLWVTTEQRRTWLLTWIERITWDTKEEKFDKNWKWNLRNTGRRNKSKENQKAAKTRILKENYLSGRDIHSPISVPNVTLALSTRQKICWGKGFGRAQSRTTEK